MKNCPEASLEAAASLEADSGILTAPEALILMAAKAVSCRRTLPRSLSGSRRSNSVAKVSIPGPLQGCREKPENPLSLENRTFTTEEKLRDLELRSQRELAEKRQELLAKEESLRNLEARLAAHNHHQLNGSQSSSIAPSPIPQQGPPVPLHDGGAANGH